MELVTEVYAMTRNFPADERFGLTTQLRRAAVSVPSNIAEGFHRSSRADYARFVSMARGSVAEVETQLLIAERLGLAPSKRISDLVDRYMALARMLGTLRKRLASDIK